MYFFVHNKICRHANIICISTVCLSVDYPYFMKSLRAPLHNEVKKVSFFSFEYKKGCILSSHSLVENERMLERKMCFGVSAIYSVNLHFYDNILTLFQCGRKTDVDLNPSNKQYTYIYFHSSITSFKFTFIHSLIFVLFSITIHSNFNKNSI